MSAFSTVGDVFSDAEFSAPGNSFLLGLCEHETTLFTPAFVDPVSSHMPVLYTCTSHSLQPALICAPTTDHDLDSWPVAQVRRR